ncbi:hypothetical protein, partial [Membranihabitans maritimus]|uniref:hypothetical protein n=1 Tax=Membranihabitans maritimus TaxID=2904244 RepID=UPI001F1823DF
GFFEKVTEEWFYSGNGNSPFWFAGAWPFISGGGECIKYMDYSEAEGEKCLAHIQLPRIEVIDGELVYNTEECVELCLKEGVHCGLAIEGTNFGAWEGQCPQTRGRNVTVTQTCWSDAPGCDAGIYQDGENENAAVTTVDSTGKRIVIELEKWQTIIDTIGPIFEYCYDIEADHDEIQSDIRAGVMPAIADDWERTHFTTYNTGSHDCTAEVYVPKVVLKDVCSGIHHVKATVNGKSVLLQGGIPDEDGYRVFNHITDPIEVPFEGADAPLREIV